MSKHLIIFCFLPWIVACNFTPGKVEPPAWNAEILGPLAKTSVEISEILELKDVSQTISVSGSALGIPASPTPVIIPGFSKPSLGPFNIHVSDGFTSVTLDSGVVYFVLTNQLPVNIKAGTQIVLKDGATTLFTSTLPNNIPSGGSYSLNPKTDLSGQTVSADLKVEILNFSSDGSVSAVTTSGNEAVSIKFIIEVLKVNKITVKSVNEYVARDTTDFDISGDIIEAVAVSGNFHCFFTNRMPVEYTIQAYFLDSLKTTIIDSLFTSPKTITAAPVNGSGQAIDTSQTKLSTTIDNVRLTSLQQAKFLISQAKFKAPGNGSQVIVSKTDSLGIQFVGDLKIKINK